MPIFESIRKSLQVIGMSTPHSMQNYPFNKRNLTSLFLHGLNVMCSVGFMVSGTKDLMEFTDSLFLSITAIIAVSIFINLNWRMQRLFEFINNLENTVDQSE